MMMKAEMSYSAASPGMPVIASNHEARKRLGRSPPQVTEGG